jgi:pimeloyl-ACP methyl ester carboxylesterase
MWLDCLGRLLITCCALYGTTDRIAYGGPVISTAPVTRSVGSAEFHVYELGDSHSPPAVYVHGEAAVRPDPLATALSATHRLTCPVMPGFGEAPRPRWVTTVRDAADLLLDLPSESGEPSLLVGVSLGAWTAAELALADPSRFNAVVLVGPVGIYLPEAPPADHWFATTDERNALLFADPTSAPDVDFAEFVSNDEATARFAWNPRFADPTLRHRLRRLDLPTLIVQGAADALVPRQQAEAWAEVVVGSRLITIDGSGHFPNYERPDEAAVAVGSFVASLIGSST